MVERKVVLLHAHHLLAAPLESLRELCQFTITALGGGLRLCLVRYLLILLVTHRAMAQVF